MKVAMLFSALCSLTSGFAQDNFKKIQFGFGGGMNYSFMSPKQTSGKYIAQPGFQFELGAKFNLSSNFYLVGALSYVDQATKYSSTSSSGLMIEVNYSFSWIALPIQFNYLIGRGETRNFFVGLGLSPRRLLYANENINTSWSGGAIGAGTASSSVDDQSNNWNLFSSIQTGTIIFLRQGGFIKISLSYERNILDLQKTPPIPSPYSSYLYDDSLSKLNSFSIGVTYFY